MKHLSYSIYRQSIKYFDHFSGIVIKCRVRHRYYKFGPFKQGKIHSACNLLICFPIFYAGGGVNLQGISSPLDGVFLTSERSVGTNFGVNGVSNYHKETK